MLKDAFVGLSSMHEPMSAYCMRIHQCSIRNSCSCADFWMHVPLGHVQIVAGRTNKGHKDNKRGRVTLNQIMTILQLACLSMSPHLVDSIQGEESRWMKTAPQKSS